MSRERRVRAWLGAHQPVLDELRSAEIRLAVALDALHREATARHADTADLVAQTASAAAELARCADTALELPEVPHQRGQLFVHAAGQRFLDLAQQLSSADGSIAPDQLTKATQEIRLARGELGEALELLASAARSSTVR